MFTEDDRQSVIIRSINRSLLIYFIVCSPLTYLFFLFYFLLGNFSLLFVANVSEIFENNNILVGYFCVGSASVFKIFENKRCE